MKQSAEQQSVQRLALTQGMLTALAILQMSPEEIGETLVAERRRNPFLALHPAGTSAGPSPAAVDQAQVATPRDQLAEQIALIRLPSRQARLAQALVHCLDDRGFLPDSADEMSGYLAASAEDIRAVVARLQVAVEPAGVFAWSLSDCFRIQLQAQNRYDPLIARLLDRLDLVAASDLEAIAAACGVDAEDAAEMLRDIRRLSPCPLQPVAAMENLGRGPDLVFTEGADGRLSVRLNEAVLPRVLADDGLFSAIAARERDAAALKYYRDCYRGAAGLVSALQKRADTLLRIGGVVARVQEKFLRTGRALDRRPLTLGMIAAEIGMNKSTVSRALKGCSFDTPKGRIGAERVAVRPAIGEGDGRTREQILQRLSLFLRVEDKATPLTDAALAEKMRGFGIALSRRTIAKYRGLLGEVGAKRRRRDGGASGAS